MEAAYSGKGETDIRLIGIKFWKRIRIQWKPLNRDASGVGILSHLSGSPE